MSAVCKRTPDIIVNGQVKESKLFGSLLSYLAKDRLLARYYWKQFNAYKNHPVIKKLQKDENGEPLLESIIKNTNFVETIPNKRLLVSLNRGIGHYRRDGTGDLTTYVDNREHRKELNDRVTKFNTTNPHKNEYVATVQPVVGKDGNIYINPEIKKRTKLASLEQSQMQSNQELNESLYQILENNGVSVGALTDLEERMGINGITDFSMAQNAADGIVKLIRIAKGDRGINALPEEFSHFALRAMKNQDLAKRLINYIASQNLAKEIIGENYEDYYIKYNGNAGLLAEEAAGKLLAQNLIKQSEAKKSYSNLLSRFINLLKNFFARIDETEIEKAMRKANNQMTHVAQNILADKIEFDAKSIKTDTKLYQLSEREERLKKVAEKLSENATKRMEIFAARAKSKGNEEEYRKNQKDFIYNIRTNIENGEFVAGISSVLLEGNKMLKQLNERIRLINNEDVTPEIKFSIYRDAKNYLASYKEVLETVRTAKIFEDTQTDNMLVDLKGEINEMSSLVGDIGALYKEQIKPELVQFLQTVFPKEEITRTIGKFKGQTITAEDILNEASRDISFASRWLDSMATTNSLLLQSVDMIVKKKAFNREKRVEEIKRNLKAAQKELEDAGVKDTDWMYARTAEGNLTGYYITSVDRSRYNRDFQTMQQELQKKYKFNTPEVDKKGFYDERNAWLNSHSVIGEDGKRIPNELYKNENYPAEGTPKRKFLDTVINLKNELDGYLPDNTVKPNKIVMIRKNLIERVKASNSPQEIGEQFWQATKDAWMYRSDDDDYGNRQEKLDFNGKRIMTLPIFFTRKGDNENMNDMSTDAVSTMIAYANMAINYDELGKVVDGLEVLKDYLDDNLNIVKTDSRGNAILEKINVMGKEVENKVFKPKADLRILERLQDYYSMQLYGRYMKDEGEFLGISKAKLANNINHITSINMLGFNMLAGISNVATGTVMMRIESFAGEHWSEKDTIYADKEYGKALPAYIAEIGKRIKTNKLSLFSEMFNVEQNFEKELHEVDANIKTRFGQIFGTGLLFTMNNAGEHWMQHRTALALAHKYKMLDAQGNETNLWKALEVKFLDENDHDKGAKLVFKEGYTKADGSKFSADDEFNFTRKSATINQDMHGVYNKLDQAAIQAIAVGRMAIMFRKWIRRAFTRRFSSAQYRMELQQETEGYYITLGNFLLRNIYDLKQGQVNFLASYNNLTNVEKSNIRRALTETGHVMILAIFLACMDWGGDKKNRPWAMKMLEYQARRLYTEVGSMTPGVQLPGEALKILKSPMAGVSTISGLLDMFALINPLSYSEDPDDLVQGGRFEGHTQAYRLFFGNKIIPGMATVNTIRRAVDPTNSTNYFKSNQISQ